MSQDIVLGQGDLSVRLGRRGGAILAAEYRGQAFLVAGGGPDGTVASFPLVPFGNRVEGNRFSVGGRQFAVLPNSVDPFYLHGDGWLGDWDVEAVRPDRVAMVFERDADARSPYAYRARQDFELSGDRLTIGLSVVNRGSTALPFGLGQHPFFLRTPGTTLHATASACWTERAGHLPGERQALPAALDFSTPRSLPAQWVNNAFEGWDGRAEIVWPELGMAAEVTADPVFGAYMIYMPVDRTDFFCFEPMTHLPNGHHLPEFGGLKLLSPGEGMAGKMSVALRRV